MAEFLLLTLTGTLVWNVILTGAGVILARNWQQVLTIVESYELALWLILGVEERVIETPPTTPVPPQEDEIVYGQALVDGVTVNIPEPEAEEVQVTVSGNLGDPCTEIDDIILLT